MKLFRKKGEAAMLQRGEKIDKILGKGLKKTVRIGE